MSQTDAHTELLLFDLAGQRLAVVAAALHRLLRAVAVVPLPGAPPLVEGVVNYRGEVTAVLDLRARFGMSPRPPEHTDHFLLVETRGRRVLLRVDRAHALTKAVVSPATEITGAAPFLAGVAKLADGMAVICDLGAFLSAAEADALDEALQGSLPKTGES